MDEKEINRLAGAMNQLRPDWPVSSLRTFLRTHFSERAFRDMAIAAAWVCTDEKTKTPELLRQSGPWWGATATTALKGTPRVGPDVGEERCRYAGHEHESATRCRLCAAERAAGDVPEPATGPAPAPAAIVELANRHRVRARSGSTMELARNFAQPEEVRQPEAFNVVQCAKPYCGGYFVKDPAGAAAHKSVFGHEPVMPVNRPRDEFGNDLELFRDRPEPEGPDA